MRKVLLHALRMLLKALGILAVFIGLALSAAQHFFWGISLFIVGLAILGLQEEGWS